MKHVDRRHFFVRECVENLQIVVPFVATADNMADFFTKPLGPKQFFALRNRIMNFDAREAAPAAVAATGGTTGTALLHHLMRVAFHGQLSAALANPGVVVRLHACRPSHDVT